MGGVAAKVVFKSGTEDIKSPTISLWEIKQKDIDGQEIRLGDLIEEKTQCVLFVNVATK